MPCLLCGECCRRYQVRLDMAEAERIAAELGMSLQAFWDKYADGRWPSQTSLLLCQKDGCCPFLQRSREGDYEICGIHSFKPLSCREWTPGLDRRECQAGLARRWGADAHSVGQLTELVEKVQNVPNYVSSMAADRRS